MTNRTSKLILAAVLLSSLPLAALADGRDCDHDRNPPVAWPAPATYPGAPAAYPAPPAGRDWREAREWRWRAHERAEVVAQLRALDAERDAFHAANAWRPGRLRRYDRSYAFRRAELERRLYELQPVAWR
jgi:hypothetical protein